MIDVAYCAVGDTGWSIPEEGSEARPGQRRRGISAERMGFEVAHCEVHSLAKGDDQIIPELSATRTTKLTAPAMMFSEDITPSSGKGVILRQERVFLPRPCRSGAGPSIRTEHSLYTL